MADDYVEKDRSDAIRFACDLEDIGVFDNELRKVAVAALVAEGTTPQAVSQAMVSFLVNHRRRTVGENQTGYLQAMIREQQRRLDAREKDTE